MRPLVPIILVLGIALLSTHAMANEQAKAKVLVMGAFHFANPKKDVIKTEQINVMTDENQKYLIGLTQRIAEFKPTVVLLEFDPENTEKMNSRYRNYLGGTYELPSGEVYQIGFRIARQVGLKEIFSFDEREIGWNAKPMFEYMKKNAPQTAEKMNDLIKKITQETKKDHATKSLSELLKDANSLEKDKFNQSMYIMTNHLGAGDSFEGADAAASWWHRNFRMYANIQKHAQPGERVLVIGGQGHTAIIKDFLALDHDRELIDIVPYL